MIKKWWFWLIVLVILLLSFTLQNKETPENNRDQEMIHPIDRNIPTH